jgi:hypothetical protein
MKMKTIGNIKFMGKLEHQLMLTLLVYFLIKLYLLVMKNWKLNHLSFIIHIKIVKIMYFPNQNIGEIKLESVLSFVFFNFKILEYFLTLYL